MPTDAELRALVAKWRAENDGDFDPRCAELESLIASPEQERMASVDEELAAAGVDVPAFLEKVHQRIDETKEQAARERLKCGMIVDPPECATECGKPATYVYLKDRTHGCCAECFHAMALEEDADIIREYAALDAAERSRT